MGASEAAALRAVHPQPRVADPARPLAALGALRAAQRRREPVVIAYPTDGTVRSPTALLVLAAAAVAGRSRVRWHLHEYSIFSELRIVLDVLLLVSGGVVVVSTPSEAAAVRRARRGWVGRRCRVHALPPANGTPFGAPPDTGPVQPPVVGVFGTARADKALSCVEAALRALPGDLRRLETIGSGWDEVAWPADISTTFALSHRGRVPADELAGAMARWTLALAPFADGATDGRMSLRTPLACGVPTFTAVTRDDDLTLRPSHLLLDPTTAGAAALATGPEQRRAGAEDVARFERRVVAALSAALWGEGATATATASSTAGGPR